MLSASECKFAAWPEVKEIDRLKQMCPHYDSHNIRILHTKQTKPLESHPILRTTWEVAGGEHPLLNIILPEGSIFHLIISGTYPDTERKEGIQSLRKGGRGKQ